MTRLNLGVLISFFEYIAINMYTVGKQGDNWKILKFVCVNVCELTPNYCMCSFAGDHTCRNGGGGGAVMNKMTLPMPVYKNWGILKT